MVSDTKYIYIITIRNINMAKPHLTENNQRLLPSQRRLGEIQKRKTRITTIGLKHHHTNVCTKKNFVHLIFLKCGNNVFMERFCFMEGQLSTPSYLDRRPAEGEYF